jgi:hypothetical protein
MSQNILVMQRQYNVLPDSSGMDDAIMRCYTMITRYDLVAVTGRVVSI